jgi:hypothetical protein
MDERRWVHLDAYLQVDGEKFDADPAAETQAAIARGNIYCSPEANEVPEAPEVLPGSSRTGG